MGTARYSREFKTEAVRLFKAGNKPVSRLAKELGIADKTLRNWAHQADADGEGGTPGVMTTPEKEELAALRKKCRELERERDFLVDAAAYFAKTKR